MPPGGAWLVEHRTATAVELHGPWPDEKLQADRVMGVFEVIGPPTLVLGSSHTDSYSDIEIPSSAGSELQGDLRVTRRSSGGGAVLVSPGAQAWVDIWLPRGDPMWDDDVVRSSAWLGHAWKSALGALDVGGLEVHTGRLVRDLWSDVICFAGTGPGEVCRERRKLVGLAQRRTRAGARFHTVSPVHPVGVPPSKILGLDPSRHREAESVLAARSTCLLQAMELTGPGDLEIAQVIERVVNAVVSAVAAVSASRPAPGSTPAARGSD
jgi:lipoate-protein ligase A